jgi:thiol:disulfide interchange protein DsbC
MKRLKSLLIFAAYASAAPVLAQAPAHMDAGAVRTALANVLPGVTIQALNPTPHAGLVEVVTPSAIYYTDATGSFLISGATVTDTATKSDLTARRLDELGPVPFSQLPVRDALKTVRGDGSRVMVTFEDPNCGYCKRLMREIDKLDNVTVYTFVTPKLGDNSRIWATRILCAPEPLKAWREFMLTSAHPAAPPKGCEPPLDRNLALFKRFKTQGVPTLLFPGQKPVPGFIDAARIEAALSRQAAAR